MAPGKARAKAASSSPRMQSAGIVGGSGGESGFGGGAGGGSEGDGLAIEAPAQRDRLDAKTFDCDT